jgi:hypothetical protein
VTEDSAPRLFGFVQFDLGGTLTVADGRYVIRGNGDEAVLVTETLGAPAPPRRRRRRPRESAPDSAPQTLPLARVTVVRSAHPFADEEDGASWLDGILADEAAIDDLVGDSVVLLNRALHISAVVGEDPHPQSFTPGRASAVRIGLGTGEEVADGDFTTALEVDVRRGGASRRQQRTEELRPQERFAGVLGGREQLDACETLLLRARADLDAGRTREAALQLRIGLDALLVELANAVDDPGHDEDVAALESRRAEATATADAALQGDLTATQRKQVEALTAICERVLRRRRVLRD